MPYDLELHDNPYEHHTRRFISLHSRSPTLGMKLVQCDERNFPKLIECLPGQSAAKMPKWRRGLRNAYITAVNDIPVKSVKDIITYIATCKAQKCSDIKINVATIHPHAMYPQHGIPQLYHDQLAHIAHHIFDIQHE